VLSARPTGCPIYPVKDSMEIMNEVGRLVIGGVDAHADTHDAVALDERGGMLGSASFPTTLAGYRALLGWLRCFGVVDRVGVESSGSYAAALTRFLTAEGVVVLEVNQPHRHTRRRRGKSDGIDAELAARHALSLQSVVTPKQTSGIVESIRQLRVARQGARKARGAALLQLGGLLVTAPAELREQLAVRKTLDGKVALCRDLEPDLTRVREPLMAAQVALRSLARRIALLDSEIAELDAQIAPLVEQTAPRTLALLGVGSRHAAQLLVTAGQNIERLHSEAAFAALCGASPIEASSGKTTRHRLNHGGDRQANHALHMIVCCRLRYCPTTRIYVERRTAEGKTKREIIRCLKRAVAREVHRTLTADLAST
jgi:transposase